MKRTNNIGLILLLVIAIATASTLFIKLLEHYFGVVNVFFGALALIPVCLIWMIIQNKRTR